MLPAIRNSPRTDGRVWEVWKATALQTLRFGYVGPTKNLSVELRTVHYGIEGGGVRKILGRRRR